MTVGETARPMTSSEIAHATANDGRRVLALEAVAEAGRGVGAGEEADPGDDQVGGAVGEAVALVGEQRRGQGQPPVVADVVDEPDADEQHQPARHRRPQQRLDREALGRRLVGHRLGCRQLLVASRLSRAVSSASATISAASSVRPWETSQRGEAGRPRRMNRMVSPAQSADAEQDPPAAGVVRDQHSGRRRDDGEAGVGGGGGPAGVAAAQRRRRDLAQVGGDGGDLGADAQARDEAEDDRGW